MLKPTSSLRIHSILNHKLTREILQIILLILVFSTAYTQSPLYTSNQNQYFLHGLARGGLGYLNEDWLAKTIDPTPIFSLLVYLTFRFLRLEALFYIFYALLMGVYLFSLLTIVSSIFDIRYNRARYLVYLALLVTIHSAAWRFALSRTLGANWSYILEDGVADQRLLGSVFEPSTFGVLLLFSISLFLRKKPFLALLSATIAATVHPTYLLSAAALTTTYSWITFREQKSPEAEKIFFASGVASLKRLVKQVRKPFALGIFALLTISPILIYVFSNFVNTPAETTAQARNILVNFRIPHHALIGWWFDATALVKILIVVSALFVTRQSRLFPILMGSTLVSAGLTILQVVLKNDALALIFPWRLSTFLVPLSTALLLAFLVTSLAEKFQEPLFRHENRIISLSLALLLMVVLIGAIRFKLDLDRKANAEDHSMMTYVAAIHAPGEIYLTPVKMQDFRLVAGSPAYIDFKSIPYRDSDVLEWYRRLKIADQFYKEDDCSLLQKLAVEEGVTHVVLNSEQFGMNCSLMKRLYQDLNFGVYKIILPK